MVEHSQLLVDHILETVKEMNPEDLCAVHEHPVDSLPNLPRALRQEVEYETTNHNSIKMFHY